MGAIPNEIQVWKHSGHVLSNQTLKRLMRSRTCNNESEVVVNSVSSKEDKRDKQRSKGKISKGVEERRMRRGKSDTHWRHSKQCIKKDLLNKLGSEKSVRNAMIHNHKSV